MEDGIIFIDKPAEMTSFGVVARVRRILTEKLNSGEEELTAVTHKRRRIKVGHCGTLDPFATGLLILVTGKMTKKAMEYTKLDKVYEAELVLGRESTTGDPEGEKTFISDIVPTQSEVEAALGLFRGEITQRPPIFSAIKVNGQRAYKLARDGKDVEIPERKVTVYSLDLIDYSYPSLKIRTHVTSGTYIRSLAVDIGRVLGTGAYCQQLRRTKIAEWKIEDAQQLKDFGIVS